MQRLLVDTAYLVEEGQREVHLYRPPARGRVPLLVVYDGTDYLQRGRLVNIVDNLIAERRIRPIAMAMLQNGGRRRPVEYACSDATVNWLDSVILPLAEEELSLLDLRRSPGAHGVLGASFGGLMSLYTGLRMPEIFGRVLCQSGVFALGGRDAAAVDLLRYGHAKDELDIWMDAGALDFLLDDSRRLQPLLRERGYRVSYRESGGGHNYTSWRDHIWRGLEALFPA
ncbi:MAG: alpha/beta hydrolase [Bacteroidota bacterium]